MIANYLEQTAKAYLMAVTGALVASADNALVTQLGEKLVAMPQGLPGYVSDGGLGIQTDAQGVPIPAGLVLNFYTGESNETIALPCVIISGAGGEEDFTAGLSGNETVQLDVAVHVPAIAYSGADDPLKVCLEISEALINALRRDDVEDYLNAHRPLPARFTAIGVALRQTQKFTAGNAVVQQITLHIYCAAMDLAPPGPA
jgi:hypothetical protein